MRVGLSRPAFATDFSRWFTVCGESSAGFSRAWIHGKPDWSRRTTPADFVMDPPTPSRRNGCLASSIRVRHSTGFM